MAVRALVIGQNYTGTGSALKWCIYDAERMAEWIGANAPGATVQFRTDQTADQLLDLVAEFADSIGPDDRGYLTYSGHGTSVADRSGDEPDGRDECWVGQDLRLATDDELRARLKRARGPVAVFSDSCNSGSVTRAMADRTAFFGGEQTRRYYPSPDPAPDLPLTGRILPTGASPILLHSGCRDPEYSYETSTPPEGGVFTTTLLAQWRPGMTHRELHKAIRQVLPTSQWPQRPCLFGSKRMKKEPVFPV